MEQYTFLMMPTFFVSLALAGCVYVIFYLYSEYSRNRMGTRFFIGLLVGVAIFFGGVMRLYSDALENSVEINARAMEFKIAIESVDESSLKTAYYAMSPEDQKKVETAIVNMDPVKAKVGMDLKDGARGLIRTYANALVDLNLGPIWLMLGVGLLANAGMYGSATMDRRIIERVHAGIKKNKLIEKKSSRLEADIKTKNEMLKDLEMHIRNQEKEYKNKKSDYENLDDQYRKKKLDLQADYDKQLKSLQQKVETYKQLPEYLNMNEVMECVEYWQNRRFEAYQQYMESKKTWEKEEQQYQAKISKKQTLLNEIEGVKNEINSLKQEKEELLSENQKLQTKNNNLKVNLKDLGFDD